MSKIQLDASNGFHIYGWMVTDLHLTGGDLLAFALVHQFAQSRAGIYKGNTTYLSAWTGWTEKTSRGHLAKLVAMGLIREYRGREENKPYCYYELTEDFYSKHPVKITASPGKNYPQGTEKITESAGKKLPGEYNNIEKKEGIDIPPTLQQVADYCREQGFKDPEGFADYYLRCQKEAQWRQKSGKPIVNWKLNVQVWRKYHKDETFPAPQTEQKIATAEQIANYLR